MIRIRRNRAVLVCAPALALCVLSLPVPAQDAPQKVMVTFTKVKPDMVTEYEQLVAQVRDGYKRAKVPWYSVWRSAAFADLYTFVSAVPLASLAELDSGLPARKALGEPAYQQYVARIRKCTAEVRRVGMISRPDLSLNSGATPGLAVVTEVIVAPGKYRAYEALVKAEIMPALKKAGYKDAWVYQTMFGGPTNRYTIVAPIPNYADLDKGPPLVRALGQEGYLRLTEKFAGVITSIENQVATYDRQLSIPPPPAVTSGSAR